MGQAAIAGAMRDEIVGAEKAFAEALHGLELFGALTDVFRRELQSGLRWDAQAAVVCRTLRPASNGERRHMAVSVHEPVAKAC
jgi:hypothetical protein